MTWTPNQNSPYNSGDQAAGVTDVVNKLQGIISQLTALVAAINGRNLYGTFTMPAASSLVINNTGVKGNSTIIFAPLNASASALEGSAKSLIYTISAGTSFTVLTGNGAAAAGTEQFNYIILTPT